MLEEKLMKFKKEKKIGEKKGKRERAKSEENIWGTKQKLNWGPGDEVEQTLGRRNFVNLFIVINNNS